MKYRFGSRGFGGGGMRRGGGPGRKTNHRIIVENLSSRTSWQVSETLLMTGKINLSVFIFNKIH